MGDWGRWLVVVLLGGGLGASGAPWPVIAAVVLFACAAFMEIDVVRLKRQAEDLQSRIDGLEAEMGVLRGIKARQAASSRS